MKIGFDAKRAFFNASGLGNYSRNTLNAIRQNCPDIEMLLFSPRKPRLYTEALSFENTKIITSQWKSRMFQSLWRTRSIAQVGANAGIEIYHGLSNEIPVGLSKKGIRSVVSVHDLIFIRHPELYNSIDRRIYNAKTFAACRLADKIVAVSRQTRDDLVRFYGVNPEKIEIIYQNCHPRFLSACSHKTIEAVLMKYELPKNFMLFVGTIETRKNVLNILKAMHMFDIELPLVLVGRPTEYLNSIVGYAKKHHLTERLFIRHNVPDEDLPAMYQSALMFVYPSLFEGFGIPVLEAVSSGVPVITANLSSLPEAAGHHSILTDPGSPHLLGKAIIELAGNESMRNSMILEGKKHAEAFSPESIALQWHTLYESLL